MTFASQFINRRQFVVGTLAAAAAASSTCALWAKPSEPLRHKFCAFTKFMQSMSYEEIAAAISAAGFDGIEVTARKKDSFIHPERAADELPKLSEVLRQHGLEITILTTDILRADETDADSMLRAAKAIGVPRYRLGFWRYDLQKPILPQLAALQPIVKDIAAMNRDIGIAAVYQNHAGAAMVGATMWDLHSLIKNYPVDEIGCVFDIRHAAVEAGEAWPVTYDLMKPHITAMSVKDFTWDGRKSKHAALGKGQVDPKFFRMVEASDFAGPISVHVEYLPNGDAQENLAAIVRDFGTLRQWLSS